MVKKSLAIFFAITLSLLLIPNLSFAQTKQAVYDDAKLLSTKEIEQLEDLATRAAKKRDINFYVLTIDHDEDIEQYMANFVDENLPEENIILVGINMKHSDLMIMGYGKGKERLDNERARSLREKITPYLSEGEFYKAFKSFIQTAESYVRYRPGVNPDNIFLKTSWQLLFAVLIAGIITFIAVSSIKPKDTTTLRTYLNDDLTKVIKRKDRYIRRTVTKHYRPVNKNNSGGGSGGASSSMGRTSGGRSYSGSRGKF